uniref:RWD domain-containing protein n=1 Tax=Monopterus albus TaxID=43700 RepID=A0A3Q3KGI0_MONAL
MTTDLEEQEDELLALQSIFDSEEFIRNESKSAGQIRVFVELPGGFTVSLKGGKYATYTKTNMLLISVDLRHNDVDTFFFIAVLCG